MNGNHDFIVTNGKSSSPFLQVLRIAPFPIAASRLTNVPAKRKSRSTTEYSIELQIVGMHALINGHKYHCIAIRIRCWFVDV
jgi:hypothetical protein